jgi:hypothetical protein
MSTMTDSEDQVVIDDAPDRCSGFPAGPASCYSHTVKPCCVVLLGVQFLALSACKNERTFRGRAASWFGECGPCRRAKLCAVAVRAFQASPSAPLRWESIAHECATSETTSFHTPGDCNFRRRLWPQGLPTPSCVCSTLTPSRSGSGVRWTMLSAQSKRCVSMLIARRCHPLTACLQLCCALNGHNQCELRGGSATYVSVS